jgi:uncharacterized membrane protein
MKTNKLTGAFLAASVASLLGSSPASSATPPAPKDGGEVKCAGINECRGHGACASATNGCNGQNGCAKQGWVKTTKKECLAKGGKLVEEAKKK